MKIVGAPVRHDDPSVTVTDDVLFAGLVSEIDDELTIAVFVTVDGLPRRSNLDEIVVDAFAPSDAIVHGNGVVQAPALDANTMLAEGESLTVTPLTGNELLFLTRMVKTIEPPEGRFGGPLFVICRSPEGMIAVVLLLTLLAETGSRLDEVTEAVFVTLPVAIGLTVNVLRIV